MIRHRLLWVGRENKRDPETQLCDRYLTRIAAFAKIESNVLRGAQSEPPPQALASEGRKLAALVAPQDYLVLCDQRGRQLTSPALAAFLEERALSAAATVTWLIGGSLGVCEDLRQRANYVLSLSEMTLPHALARVVLLEQIYRAHTIAANHPYHHEG